MRIPPSCAPLGVVFMMATLAAACSRGTATAGSMPLDTLSLPSEVGDSAKVAALAHERCAARPAPEKPACYEEILFALVARDRVRLAMGALHLIGDADPEVRHNSHQYTHGIGITAYRPDKDIAEIFQSCTELYQSGCYHGVIQAYFGQQAEVTEAQVRALCAAFTQAGADQWIRFQCVHGMGHGLTMYHAGHVPMALEGCDMLEQRWDQLSCYGGVFMENIVGTTEQQHHAQAAAGEGAPAVGGHDHMAGRDHAGMDHGAGMAAAPPFPSRKAEDPYYPCSVVGPKYQDACYSMQSGLMLERTNRDFAATARLCSGAPERFRPTCYQSIGTNAAGESRDDGRALALCYLGEEAYQPWCVLGLVRNRVNVTARAADGLPVCAIVKGEGNRQKCYEALGLETAILMPAPASRAAFCDGLPADVRASCRFGARLGTPPPPNLPLRRGDDA